jgi:hypothetical protein
MPNTFAPFGFAESHRLGAAPDYQISKRYINPANANPIYFGDPVAMIPGSGYISQALPGAAPNQGQIAGVFIGCEYMSRSSRKPFWSPWWSGSTGDVVTSGTGFDVGAKIVDDPLLVFRVQANGQLNLGMIGNNATFAYGIGGNPPANQMSGVSNACLDVVTPPTGGGPPYLPFRIVDLIRDPPGVNGTDITSPFGWAFVTFNNQDYKVLTGHG